MLESLESLIGTLSGITPNGLVALALLIVLVSLIRKDA